MNTRKVLMLILLVAIPALLFNNCTMSSEAAVVMNKTGTSAVAGTIVNVDGDVSLGDPQDRTYWNPHVTGFTDPTNWSVSFQSETCFSLKTVEGEAGHVAAGAWWTCNFKSAARIPLFSSNPHKVLASFRADVVSVRLEKGDEWLRIALASAVKRGDGSVVYTEMDFWDSPKALEHPSGNVASGGDVVYDGGDVTEYKMAQADVGHWSGYSFDLTQQIDRAWSLRSGDSLESVYVVIEAVGSVSVTLKVDDLWITLVE